MDVRSETPFWLFKNGYLYDYPSLKQDLNTQVLVIGGGITGALVSYYLTAAGIETIVVDRKSIGMGSTCASTGLLQYEIDTPLHVLIQKVGKAHAQQSYQLCLESIHTLQRLSNKLYIDPKFQYKDSFFYASRIKDVDLIQREYDARKAMGIDLELLCEQEIATLFPAFKAKAALFSPTAAQVDPYILTHGLLQKSIKEGLQVFDNTEIIGLNHSKKKVVLKSEYGHTITAHNIVYATGYESVKLIEKAIARLHSTYALISEPFRGNEPLWHKECLIWETAHPYLYERTTEDRRIIIGGKDEVFYSPGKRDRLLTRKKVLLEEAFARLFPHLKMRTDYAWCGTFAETKDGLPYIGKHPAHPNAYFALGFGGNGITFSVIAAEHIRDSITGKKNNNLKLFGFDR